MSKIDPDAGLVAALSAKLDHLITVAERIAPPKANPADLTSASAFVWNASLMELQPVASVNRVDISLLKGIDRSRNLLVENTRRFAKGLPANNVLLWGARGMGKSSLVKAAHHAVTNDTNSDLKLVEIHREDISTLPVLLGLLKEAGLPALLFCDDLSFDHDDTDYKALKAALDGGIEGRPENVLLYATSNRRHLLPRDMIDNERSTAINPSEAVHEKVSLSDRFGLWLGFHNCSQDDYLSMVEGYAEALKLPLEKDDLRQRALTWATGRGGRSGRVAWQFTQDLAGELGVSAQDASG
ncbi:MAG: ATP-binding protein [Pseudomonadota bacterium]